MGLTAFFLGILGIVLTFVPLEILDFLKLSTDQNLQLFLQILGALYFGFAMLNWMTKDARTGGIYNRPVVVANFAHFMIAGLALLKATFSLAQLPTVMIALTLIYAIFAVVFAILLFRHPK